MASVVQRNFRIRNSYGQVKRRVEVPNLIDLQKKSYDKFLQKDVPAHERVNVGLQAAFKSIFPITDNGRRASIEFDSYSFDEPTHTVTECLQRTTTYQARLKVRLRAISYTDEGALESPIEDDIFFGEIPLQTDEGTFIVNGTERVIVSQLQRSPGTSFSHDGGKGQGSKFIYSARIIPYRGSWLDFEFDSKDILHARIDRRRKVNATVLLRAMGYTTQEIMTLYYPTERIELLDENPRLARRYYFHEDYLKGNPVLERRDLALTHHSDALKKLSRKVKLKAVFGALEAHTRVVNLKDFNERASASSRCANITASLGGDKLTWLFARPIQSDQGVTIVEVGEALTPEVLDLVQRSMQRTAQGAELALFNPSSSEAMSAVRAALSKLTKGVDGVMWGFTYGASYVSEGAARQICAPGDGLSLSALFQMQAAGLEEASVFCADGGSESDLMREMIRSQLRGVDDVSSWYIFQDVALDADGAEVIAGNTRLSFGHLARLAFAGHEKVSIYRTVSFTNRRQMERKHNVSLEGGYVLIRLDDLKGAVSAEDIYSAVSGELIKGSNQYIGGAEEGERLDVDTLIREGIKVLNVYLIDDNHFSPALRNTLMSDLGRASDGDRVVESPGDVAEMRELIRGLNERGENDFGYREDLSGADLTQIAQSLKQIYARIRPGDPAKVDGSYKLLRQQFFAADRYDLSEVGRMKLNHKFKIKVDLAHTTLTPQDIVESIRYILALRDDNSVLYRKEEDGGFTKLDIMLDDIDHLGNRRVRVVGELMEQQFRTGLVRMERGVKERLGPRDEERGRNLKDMVNPKPVSGTVKEFFGSSQLSQFMDQTNPLSEVTHKRRLSALGPGGLNRDRAGFEVRDVHMTHYGRICPIETPEGPNIGLIASLSTYAQINDYGFIETPYRRVRVYDEQGAEVTKESVAGARRARMDEEYTYYNALDEEYLEELWQTSPNKYNGLQHIAQAKLNVDDGGWLLDPIVNVRASGDFITVAPHEVNLVDVSPNQLVSVAASLIPFLENDDANRALMGSNMQRQAVPLLVTRAPLVGTGMEIRVGKDSGVTVVAKRDGVVDSVDAERVVIRPDSQDSFAEPDIYNLVKFRRSNQNTCLNQRPIVERGDRVRAGDVIADGASTEQGELALGRNVVVAFMPWCGYNFEDSILISERLVQEDVYTSIHIEEFECSARNNKLGDEEITRDIPMVNEATLNKLDQSGIIRIGTYVQAGDILVGKTTPKGETPISAEERLNQAIFGHKAKEVSDTSLRVRTGVSGTVIGVKVFNSKEKDLSDREKGVELSEVAKLSKERDAYLEIIYSNAYRELRALMVDQKSSVSVRDEANQVIIKRNDVLTADLLSRVPDEKLELIRFRSEGDLEERLDAVKKTLGERVKKINEEFEARKKKLLEGDDMMPGVLEMVKVYVAIKRKLQVGDKMAGRHGNKGVISRVLPLEDMPFLEDGTPVEMVLNPLGVPSRMNIGQILETHLGWAARGLGLKINRLLESGVVEAHLRDELKRYYSDDAHQALIDSMGLEDLQAMIRGLREGVHVASPVFDGAPEHKLKEALALAGLRADARSVLFDGRTGRAFDNLVTVGVMYVLKLHHLVDEKIHARSVGPYSLVTQQPLGGKAQLGGQRLGEMEVWAMEAYGAAYTLQEFLTVKSDDIVGRSEMYKSIVKNSFDLKSGLPESFRVLIQELKSLALNVETLNLEDE
ncbi:MAG: DNA-directed RNA polymerase subunit beta [Deltaproteobacteria bacterium]|nr:DNA-directed RNA polymerase subunit beta [Deltaproteobacteria bacterium]